MKYYLGLLPVIFSLTAYSQTNPFDTLKFDKVIMYDFNEKGQEIPIVDKRGQLDSSVTKRVELDKKTIDQLNKRLGRKSSYVESGGLCFFPHLGFVYYKKENIVASITVCLHCHQLISTFEIPAQKKKTKFMGHTLDVTGGLSDNMMDYLNSLVKSNKFSHPAN